MKVTAKAPSNIAFIKYWGKKDEDLRLPLNTSISMNLTGAFTVTTVEFSSVYDKDSVTLRDGIFSENEEARITACLERIRKRTNIRQKAKVVTINTFPKGAGAAASASGFAALTVSGFAAANLTLSEKELTIFARMGSGSACRSIPDGFVLWEKGKTSEDSYAYSLYPHTYWDIRDALVIVDSQMKKVSTTEGMEHAATSPLLAKRLANLPQRIDSVKHALKEKDFSKLGELIEEDCLEIHQVMQTQIPPICYWNETTKILMEEVAHWRKSGLPVYFTIDAGPNIHLIYKGKDEDRVVDKIHTVNGIETVILNKPAEGTRLIEEHVF